MSPSRIRPWIPEVILAAVCAALSLWIHRPALAAYFSPDDLILLERAQGFAPRLSTAWRFLSGRAYFDLVVPWFGTDPAPYLRVNWLLHGLAVVLLYAWARRHGGPVAATVEVRRGRHADAAAACRRALELGGAGAVADSARAILHRIASLDGTASRH